MDRSEKVWAVCSIICGGLLIAILYHCYVGIALGSGYPSNTFFFRPELVFSDFYDIFFPVQQGNPVGSRSSVYFPFAYVPLYALIGFYPTNALRITVILFASGVFYFFWCKLHFMKIRQRLASAMIMAFLTYPFMFCIHRGNIEMIVLLFVLGFFVMLGRREHFTAGAFLACATAMKLYPGALGVLLLQRRQYKASVLTGVLTVVLTLASAATFPGGIRGTLDALQENLQYFYDYYILSGERIYMSSSYFSVLKLSAAMFGEDARAFSSYILPGYTAACIVIFSTIVLYTIRYERLLWRQASLLCFAMILLPEVSYDYKLIHILVPLGLFVSAPPGRLNEDRFYAALLGALLIPKAYAPIGQEITIGVLLNPLLMTTMIVRIIWSGLRAKSEVAGAG